ncbi:hypothetical protein [Leptospira weilii]|uniref:Uncharacterized protein n=1 Tax=Leptospira weilii str. UI 13098 TaxID=1088542 RepID=M6QFG0_9LEPT|nr:hypothetical protein LEP1GSC108_3272 [Leptospira weilii str. UI 13098]
MIFEIEEWLDTHPGITNKLMKQTALLGALSAEPVPSMDFSELETIQLIPVSRIRFKKEKVEGKNGEVRYRFAPFQLLDNGSLLQLNEELYTYEALETNEDSPYAIPPAISALKAMFTQAKGMSNVDRSTNKWSFLGFISVLLKKPKIQPGQDIVSSEMQSKNALKTISKDIEKSLESGMLVGYDGTQIQYSAIGSEKSSVFKDTWNVIEEQISSGLDIDLFMLGRPTAVTETYAKVSSKLFLMKGENLRHPTKRFMEKAMTLHLRCKGYKFTRLKAKWKSGRSLNPDEDATAEKTKEEAETIRVNRYLTLFASGIIDADTAAQHIGFEKATGTAISKKAFKAILRLLKIDPLSKEGLALVNKYEHGFKRNERDHIEVLEPDSVSSDEELDSHRENDHLLEKKNGTLNKVVPIRGRKN